MSSSSMRSQDIGGTDALAQSHVNETMANDLDAAKVAAMRAAELGMICLYTSVISMLGYVFSSKQSLKRLNCTSQFYNIIGVLWDLNVYVARPNAQELFLSPVYGLIKN